MSEGLQLVMSQGPNPGRAFPLDGDSSTIGRDPSNEIAIDEARISRLHARVYLNEGVLTVEDMGSTNGTFVNGLPLTGPRALTPGDIIGRGEAVTLTYYSTGAISTAAMSAPPPGPEPLQRRPVPGPLPARPPIYPAMAAGASAGAAPAILADSPRVEPEAGWDAEEADKDSRRRKSLLIGCGCLALLLTCVAIALFLWYAPAAFWEFLIRLGIPIPPNPF